MKMMKGRMRIKLKKFWWWWFWAAPSSKRSSYAQEEGSGGTLETSGPQQWICGRSSVL
jgi:hypothetical protein